MYSFDLLSLILDVLPALLRGSVKLVALCEAMLAPMAQGIADMPAYALEMKRQARWNGQRAIMEEALNHQFPAGLGLILVETVTLAMPRTTIWFLTEGQPPLYIFNEAEAQPPLYIYSQAEMLTHVDFRVLVPTGAPVDFNQVIDFTKRLKIAGKRFEVINY